MITRLLLPFTAALLSLPLVSWSSPPFPAGYDSLFNRYWGRYLSQVDPLAGKAQCYQESRLDPRAVSPAGAMGLCQFMPPTHRQCVERLRLPGNPSPFDAEVSIICNAWYMSTLFRTWRAERPDMERLKLALASYNAGAGNIIQAQRICGDESFWKNIAPCLPLVTGRHAEETINYVERIQCWYGEMYAINLSENRGPGGPVGAGSPVLECGAAVK